MPEHHFQGHPLGLIGSELDHWSLPPEFEYWRGHIWKVFHLWLRFITFGGRSVHLAYDVHTSSHKTSINNISSSEHHFDGNKKHVSFLSNISLSIMQVTKYNSKMWEWVLWWNVNLIDWLKMSFKCVILYFYVCLKCFCSWFIVY